MVGICALFLLVLSIPLGCAAENPRTSQSGRFIQKAAATHLNHLFVRYVYSDEQDFEVDIWYPPAAILVAFGDPSGMDSSLQYERCYELAGKEIPRDVMAFRCGGDHIYPVPGSGGTVDGREFAYGKRGNVIYRFNWAISSGLNQQFIAGQLASHIGYLHETAVLRAEVRQLVDSHWLPLTRFRFGGGTGFWLAPEDTIQMRARFGAHRARYFVDRVVIDAQESSREVGLKFAIARPNDGYWPPKPVQRFFREHTLEYVSAGEDFEWAYETKSEPVVQMYTLDVHASMDNDTSPMRFVLAFGGPNMAPPESPDSVSDWPLNLGEMENGSRLANLGYPGSAIVPQWAVGRLLELGDPYSSWSAPNQQAHAEFVREWIRKGGASPAAVE